MLAQIQMSAVLSVYNEQGNLNPSASKLFEVFGNEYDRREALFLDDGSTGESFETFTEIHDAGGRFKMVSFRGNFVRRPAIDVGLDYAIGETVVTWRPTTTVEPTGLQCN